MPQGTPLVLKLTCLFLGWCTGCRGGQSHRIGSIPCRFWSWHRQGLAVLSGASDGAPQKTRRKHWLTFSFHWRVERPLDDTKACCHPICHSFGILYHGKMYAPEDRKNPWSSCPWHGIRRKLKWAPAAPAPLVSQASAFQCLSGAISFLSSSVPGWAREMRTETRTFI